MTSRTVTLAFTNNTKRTNVYNEVEPTDGTEKVFPTIYVQKSAFPPGPPPATITVTVEFGDGS